VAWARARRCSPEPRRGRANEISAADGDALGLIRTNELLKADEFYGVRQLWGTEVDFGFSKLRRSPLPAGPPARALRRRTGGARERPQVILSTFVGGVSDGTATTRLRARSRRRSSQPPATPRSFPSS